ncbi:MAG: hypothetical protein ACXV2I_10275 [Actinomycetes bacterium]
MATASVVAAVLSAVRWATRRRDEIGRPRPFPLISVLLLAALGGGLLVPVIRHHRLESRLSDVSSTLVGVPVVVHCQTAGSELVDVGPELGYVRYGADGVPEHATLIKRPQCGDLAAYLRSDHRRPSRDQVVAVHVLSHEARHMAGTTNEAQAECEAVQRDAQTAQLLGADAEQARELARTYWRDVYPRLSDDYVTGDCAPGGRLDERRADAPWAVGANAG